jgi:hypothetical protein
MSQFDSELEANSVRRSFDALDKPMLPIGWKLGAAFLKLLSAKNPTELLKETSEVIAGMREDAEARSREEQNLLLETVVLTVERHERALNEMKELSNSTGDRLAAAEDRLLQLEAGLRDAMSYRTNNDRGKINMFASIIVRGALDFRSKPIEETAFFLSIAAQMTSAEVEILQAIYEAQKDIPRPGERGTTPSHWLQLVQNGWSAMKRKMPSYGSGWMRVKSACVRLQSYGFLEPIERNPTAEHSSLGDVPYALLDLGREFCEYARKI